jgi:hypothetical protein
MYFGRADINPRIGQGGLPSEKAGRRTWCLHKSEMDWAGWPSPYNLPIVRSDYTCAWSPRDSEKFPLQCFFYLEVSFCSYSLIYPGLDTGDGFKTFFSVKQD